jgi:hypothetical protein
MAVGLAGYHHQIAGHRPRNDSNYPLRRGVWTSGDLERLGQDIRRKRVRWGQVPGRLLGIARSFLLADFHLTWTWRDPLPTLCVFAAMMRAGFRRSGEVIFGRQVPKP